MKTRVRIIAVHPTTVIVQADDRQFELPLSSFPANPTIGQDWTISLEHETSEAEQIEQLNRYLARD